MRIWVDSNVSPSIAAWINETFSGVEATSLWKLNRLREGDSQLFDEARLVKGVILTKDQDFAELVETGGAPPQVIWLKCGDLKNVDLRRLLAITLPQAIRQIKAGNAIVVIE